MRKFKIPIKIKSLLFSWRHDTQHNDIQHEDTQHKGFICDTQHL
jgi:hypothetical protein